MGKNNVQHRDQLSLDALAFRVYETMEYDKFKKIDGNRAIDPNNLKRLILAMGEKDMRVPILVTTNFEIIDGQHRVEARKKLMLPVYYMITDAPPTADSIILTTMAQKPLTVQSIMETRAKKGDAEYARMLEYRARYGFSSTLTMQLTWKDYKSGKSKNANGTAALHRFKMGDYKCDSIEFAEDVGDYVMALYKACGKNIVKSGYFVMSLVEVMKVEGFDIKHMISQFGKYRYLLDPKATKKQNQDMIHDIYNYKTRSVKRLNLRAV